MGSKKYLKDGKGLMVKKFKNIRRDAMKKVVFFLLVFFLSILCGLCKTDHSLPDKGSDGCDYTSIQAAINAAANGDEIYIKKRCL